MKESKVKEGLRRTILDLEFHISEAERASDIVEALDGDSEIHKESIERSRDQLKKLKDLYGRM